jgi:processive 1,2-diacylglycerol beta-glucosyltransferase
MWLSRLFHRYFVALDETKAHLEALGLPAQRITVTGIPIDPIFSLPIDRAATRRTYGLDVDKTTLLLSAGALGVGPTEVIVRHLMSLRHRPQTIVVCGKVTNCARRSFPLPARTIRRSASWASRSTRIVRISDLFIGKPGGLEPVQRSPVVFHGDCFADSGQEGGTATTCWKRALIKCISHDHCFQDRSPLYDPATAAMAERARAIGPRRGPPVVRTLLEDDLPPLVLDEEKREAMTLAATGEVGNEQFLLGWQPRRIRPKAATTARISRKRTGPPPAWRCGTAGGQPIFWNRYEEISRVVRRLTQCVSHGD